MADSKKFVTGFNHNVQHKGLSYHVQTEDSGAAHGHIITHLFQGGNILASKKTSYQEMIGAPTLRELVRALMEEQHKEMLRNLVSGVYDNPLPKAPARAAPQPPPPALPRVPKPTPTPVPPPLAGAPGWPWAAKGQQPVPFGGQKEREVASWPAGGGKAAPPPLPGAIPDPAPAVPRAAQKAPTLFSEDLVSDRSLDEVILRYLSGDTDDD